MVALIRAIPNNGTDISSHPPPRARYIAAPRRSGKRAFLAELWRRSVLHRRAAPARQPPGAPHRAPAILPRLAAIAVSREHRVARSGQGAETIYLTTGHTLYSNRSQPMLEIDADTVERAEETEAVSIR